MKKTEFTREELYELLWTEPASRLAKKFQITDTGLRKKCRKAGIPLPPMGYWQKLKYNKPVRKIALPKKYSGPSTISLTERDDENPNIITPISRKKAILKTYNALNPNFFRVPSRLTNPDKLIIAAQKSLTHQRTSEWSHWLVNTNSGEIDIKVAPTNVKRALRLFNSIIKLLRSRGHDVIINGRNTHAVIEGENIEIALREKLRIEKTVEKNGWNTNKYFPTGKFIFRVERFQAKEFIDTKILLETNLPSILAELEYRGQKEKEDRIEREIYWDKEKEQKRIEKELEDRKSLELDKFKRFITEVDQWHHARILRDYIHFIQGQESTILDKGKTWTDWAKQKVNWYDPTILGKDELLDDWDRKKLIEDLSECKKQITNQSFYPYYK